MMDAKEARRLADEARSRTDDINTSAGSLLLTLLENVSNAAKRGEVFAKFNLKRDPIRDVVEERLISRKFVVTTDDTTLRIDW